jgi:hypothetical protein
MARDAWREVDDCFIETRSRRKCDRNVEAQVYRR